MVNVRPPLVGGAMIGFARSSKRGNASLSEAEAFDPPQPAEYKET